MFSVKNQLQLVEELNLKNNESFMLEWREKRATKMISDSLIYENGTVLNKKITKNKIKKGVTNYISKYK